MTLYLVRHAIAEPRGPVWPNDGERPLTPRGIARMREIALRLADRGVQVERIWTSPLVRARQTADIIAPLWCAAKTIAVVPELAPGHAPSRTAAALAELRSKGPFAAVGHEPDLGTLAAWLIGAESPLLFKKGGVARIEVPGSLGQGDGTLSWLLTPKLILDD